MKRNWDYNLDDLLSETRSLIKDLEGQISPPEKHPRGQKPAHEVPPEVYQNELKALKNDHALRYNGYADIRLSEDRMEAYADFHPPSMDGEELQQGKVEAALEEAGVTAGIDWNVVGTSIFSCNTEKTELHDVVVARGTPASHEIPEHYEIEPRLLQDPHHHIRARREGKGRVDFHEVSGFILVKEGERIAHLVESREGRNGVDITGKEIPFKRESPPNINFGDHIRIQDNMAIATCSGRFHYEGGTAYLEEVLDIQADVDYSTGNIDFPGDVVIRGQVKEGFSVKTGGILECMATLDATRVICGGNLLVKQGIIGKNEGIISCGGSVETRFIENCYLEAEGAVQVELGIMNTVINTRDRIVLGQKGIIVGGKATAQKGIETFQVGTLRGPKTELLCGIDYKVKQKLEWARDKNLEIYTKLKIVEDKIAAGDCDTAELEQTRDRLKKALEQLNTTAMDLVVELDKSQDAGIVVHGTVYANTYIEICNTSFVVTRDMQAVKFFLDPESGRVKYLPLSEIAAP